MDDEHERTKVSKEVIISYSYLYIWCPRVDSIEKLKAKRSEFEKVFLDVEQFKEMYKYTFSYAKNRDQKCMDVDVNVCWFSIICWY
jgi:hypothetical protein